ncbi:hypothetical protein HJC23_006239 [Cyclotella cryptica]|uniref:Hexosyltransferase n=1 Tax=Cyclotella cryptica TaxID=29204 RepID=A0ABD3PWE8_9STRA|eukprot:CCRYP_010859-RA/>CCRYP_010859-RA protein AED:0.13 eAED:0.13 QI:0/-1/0/1/-1/1/1/0/455
MNSSTTQIRRSDDMCQPQQHDKLPSEGSSAAFLPKPSETFRRRIAVFRRVILVIYLQASFFVVYWTRFNRGTHPAKSQPKSRRQHSQDNRSNRLMHKSNANKKSQTPNISLVGISYSDETVSDAAIEFLLEAACTHNMESYILLSKRIPKTSLDRKISLLSQHKHMPLAKGGTLEQPKCTNLIHIELAPNQRELIRQTEDRLKNDGVNIASLKSANRGEVPNNPLVDDNRIANIKRVREYQRQLMRDSFYKDNERNASGVDDSQFVLAVMDLDMFDYPSVSQVMDVSERYIVPHYGDTEDGTTKFHAICANGLQRGRFGQSHPHRGYYDTFATILLPNTWLHPKRAQISQEEIMDWFIDEGADGSTNGEATFHPVPVRSCFGGFTLYRADVWLDPSCRYDRYSEGGVGYIGSKEHHTCEHVVLHECLREKFGGEGDATAFSIAVLPNLLTLWHLI